MIPTRQLPTSLKLHVGHPCMVVSPVDEEDFNEEQRKRARDLLSAAAESLALATKSELEIEARLKSED